METLSKDATHFHSSMVYSRGSCTFMYKTELNDFRIINCLRKPIVSVEIISVCNIIVILAEHDIHALCPCDTIERSYCHFWPGLGLPMPKAIVVIPNNQPLPKHLRKKTSKSAKHACHYATKNKRAMMALGRSPEYHWNQIISKSVHRFNRRNHLKLFPIYSPGGHFVQQSGTV